MKILIFLLPLTLFANNMECESVLTLFDNSIQQGKPISDALLMMTIAYCEDIPQYEQVLSQMMYILDTTEILQAF